MINHETINWERIVSEYTENPRDVQTVPVINKEGLWFYVHTENRNVYITDAENHKNSSRIGKPIKLQKDKFDDMLRIYLERKHGKAVSQEATKTSYQQVYWYGIFCDLDV